MTEFDPAEHRMVPQQRWFEDFVLGERFVIPSRTQTSAVFAAFQTASGDTHPIHYDVEYCRARGMPNLLAHGFQTLVHTAPGAGLFPYLVEQSLVGFLEQSSRFLKPVYAGDTIYPALEVTELVPGRSTGVVTLRSTVHNQRRELVLEGTQPPAGVKRGRLKTADRRQRLLRKLQAHHILTRSPRRRGRPVWPVSRGRVPSPSSN
jgi:acyl dehydratase